VQATGWTDASYEAVAALLHSRTGLSFTPNRCSSAEAGIKRAMSRTAISHVGEYLHRLQADAPSLDDLVSEVTVGETYFFREPAHFQFIRDSVLRGLTSRRPDPALRVWSAGCASGEEAYSLAILLREEGFADHAFVLATDISRAALAQTREATYSRWALRGADAPFIGRYFRVAGERFRLTPTIRDRVTVEYLNLTLDSYPSIATQTYGMDVVLCRNVLIYFGTDAISRVAALLQECLAPGGWLITGPSDPLLPVASFCEAVTTPAGVFYRRTRVGADKLFEHQHDEPLTLPAQSEHAAHPTLSVADPLVEARAALKRGDYPRVLDLTTGLRADAAACELEVQALANLGASERAEQAAASALVRHPGSLPLHFLRVVLLMSLGRDAEAVHTLRRMLYLDRSLTVGHFLLGSVLQRQHDLPGAIRAYRTAYDLAVKRPGEEIVPLSDGELTARLAEAARMKVSLLSMRPDATL
jgi:chemotaxis protein methyltransferase CheR